MSHIYLLLLTLIGLVNAATDLSKEDNYSSYSILPESSLVIYGTSNVNEFSCSCEQSWGSYPVRYETNTDRTVWSFHDVGLDILVKSLDCGNRQMSKDLAETLKADRHPHIRFNILEAIQKDKCRILPKQECLTNDINVEVEIAGVTKVVRLEVDCYFIDENTYHFSAFHSLDMRDFNIVPPKVLLGLIQVNKNILLDIDLRVSLSEHS